MLKGKINSIESSNENDTNYITQKNFYKAKISQEPNPNSESE